MPNRLLRLEKEHEEIRKRQGALLSGLDKRSEEGGETDFTTTEAAEYDSLDSERVAFAANIQRELEYRASELNVDTVTSTIVGDDQATDVTKQDDIVESVIPTPYANFGEQLQDIQCASKGHGMTANLLEVGAAAQGAGTANPSEGGFLVQTDFASEIMRKAWETGQIINRVTRLSLSSNADSIRVPALKEASRATGSRLGGVQGYWVDEGTAPTATNPALRVIELKVNKIAALGYATNELMSDASALASIMTAGFADEISFLVENAIFRGTGSGQPLGILAHASAIDVAKETGQGANTIEYENVQAMWARLYSRGRANAVWLINQDAEQELFNMSLAIGTGGVPVYLPAGGLSQSPFGTLMGRPVIPIEYASTLGTTGDLTLVDLSQYVIVDKGNVLSAESMHVRFINDEIAFRVTYRVDGQPTWESAVTPFQGTDTQSAIITLATRA